MRILDRSVYVGPSLYAHFPVIRLELDLGELEAWPTGKLGAALRRRPGRGAARPRRARLLLPRAGRLHPPHERGRGHLARPRARARRDRAAERRRRGRHLRQDPQPRRGPGCTPSSTSTREREEGIAAGELALRLLCSLLPREAAHRRRGARGLGLADRARRVHPLRAAPRARAVDRLAGARRRGARHPLAAAQRPVAGPARPRQVPAAHPGDGHRHARRTSRSSSPATRRRPTRSSARSACRCRARNWCRASARRVRARATPRLPGGDQAAQRQPRPRHLDHT